MSLGTPTVLARFPLSHKSHLHLLTEAVPCSRFLFAAFSPQTRRSVFAAPPTCWRVSRSFRLRLESRGITVVMRPTHGFSRISSSIRPFSVRKRSFSPSSGSALSVSETAGCFVSLCQTARRTLVRHISFAVAHINNFYFIRYIPADFLHHHQPEFASELTLLSFSSIGRFFFSSRVIVSSLACGRL
jgi:hypothetical protein